MARRNRYGGGRAGAHAPSSGPSAQFRLEAEVSLAGESGFGIFMLAVETSSDRTTSLGRN